MENLYDELVEYINQLGKTIVAFSGGVDSTLLAVAAYDALGKDSLALTLQTPYVAQWEVQEAVDFSENYGFAHQVIQMDIPKSVFNNDKDRCYHCKKALFTYLLEYASSSDFTILEGTNVDDLSDYRPGLRAIGELGIISPFRDLGWSKSIIRKVSKLKGLSTFDKPAYACLLSRIPYNTVLNDNDFRKVESAESLLMANGLKQVRVRVHGNVARIELPKLERDKLFELEEKIQLTSTFKKIGFDYVSVDLLGYRMGSMNDVL